MPAPDQPTTTAATWWERYLDVPGIFWAEDTQEGRWQFAVKRFKVEWEMPEMGPNGENVPRFYQGDGETPLDPNGWPSEQEVPWRSTSREDEDVASIQDQYTGLKQMEETGHPIRNVKVYQSEVVWSEMKAKATE